MVDVLDLIQAEYGGPCRYLTDSGLPPEALEELRRRMSAAPDAVRPVPGATEK